jgi:regulator of protease activity HflC (stomatin/prohibitin superfamily)
MKQTSQKNPVHKDKSGDLMEPERNQPSGSRHDNNLRNFGNFLSRSGMFQFRIEDFRFAIVTEFGIFKKILRTGTHNYNPITESIKIYDQILVPEFSKGVLIRDKKIIEVLDEGRYEYNEFLGEKIEIIPLMEIRENHKGILTRNGVFVKTLDPGLHFVNKFNKEHLDIIQSTTINENQKGILTERGCFKQILNPGQYYENPALEIKIIVKDLTVIKEGHIGLKCVNGKLTETLDPGLYLENSFMNESITDVNMQVQTKELKPQTIVTKDTVSITIYSVLIYQITDAYKATFLVNDIDFTIRETIKIVSHQVLSEHTLDECMNDKISHSNEIKKRVAENCTEFGVKIDRIDIKDIIFGEELKEALTAAAKAKRIAESKLITARAEVEAAKLMREAADQMDSESAMQMRNLDALQQMSMSGNTHFYFFSDGNMANLAKHQMTKEIVKKQCSESMVEN